jgi:hypothetical protein
MPTQSLGQSLSHFALAVIQYAEAGHGMEVERSAGRTLLVIEDAALFESLLAADDRISRDVADPQR